MKRYYIIPKIGVHAPTLQTFMNDTSKARIYNYNGNNDQGAYPIGDGTDINVDNSGNISGVDANANQRGFGSSSGPWESLW